MPVSRCMKEIGYREYLHTLYWLIEKNKIEAGKSSILTQQKPKDHKDEMIKLLGGNVVHKTRPAPLPYKDA